jgi:formylglycine-generating enzyme
MKFNRHSNRVLMLIAALSAPLAGADISSANIIIATVPVGNPDNAPDPLYGYGQVNYTYNIGEYDVTSSQYTAFLNAVAGVDTYGLYNSNMAGGGSAGAYGCGISIQSGNGTLGEPYIYSVAPGFVNRPVTWVSFWDATRFANWLDNGQPIGAEGPGTTETGTYTLTAESIANITVTRNAGTTWAVASENEWYKAAYYDPATSSYYQYPTSSNTQPGTNLADPTGNDANYFMGATYPIDNGYYTTPVGQFANSPTPYGTFDQGGDVFQWNDSIWLGEEYGRRGRAYDIGFNYLESGNRNNDYPADISSDTGFRVSEVPEPASLGILGLGVIGMLIRRRRGKWRNCGRFLLAAKRYRSI